MKLKYRKVGYAEYSTGSETGNQANAQDTRRGTVTVRYANSWRNDEFTGISRKEFLLWESAGWSPDYCPKGIRLQTVSEDD